MAHEPPVKHRFPKVLVVRYEDLFLTAGELKQDFIRIAGEGLGSIESNAKQPNNQTTSGNAPPVRLPSHP